MRKNGDRVGAILSSKDGIVKFIGYGKYVGDAIPKEAIGFMAKALTETKNVNPKIELDSGKVVYGCECWWGSESRVKEILDKSKEIVNVGIDEIRKENQQK